MEEERIVEVKSVDEDVVDVHSIDEDVVNIDSGERDIFYIKEKFDWLVFAVSDWQLVNDSYRLVIPYQVHGCLNPFVDCMLIAQGDEHENNIPTWKVTSADSIVITSDNPINCKVLIKGDK